MADAAPWSSRDCALEPRSTDVGDLVARAEALCAERAQRFTPIRKTVYEIVASAAAPITAYQILDRMLAFGRETGPPTIYRALDFLLQQNLVHRIESLNAFVPCGQPQIHHSCQFLICTGCGTTAEVEAEGVMAGLSRAARALGFSVSEAVLELKGVCARCSNALLALARVQPKDKPS